MIIAAAKGDKAETVYELGDLAYHALVLMAEMGITVRRAHPRAGQAPCCRYKSQAGAHAMTFLSNAHTHSTYVRRTRQHIRLWCARRRSLALSASAFRSTAIRALTGLQHVQCEARQAYISGAPRAAKSAQTLGIAPKLYHQALSRTRSPRRLAKEQTTAETLTISSVRPITCPIPKDGKKEAVDGPRDMLTQLCVRSVFSRRRRSDGKGVLQAAG